jgi:L-seryl-tRNA(Ser) seleniumtransferase
MDPIKMRKLPAVDELLQHPLIRGWQSQLPRPMVVAAIRACLAQQREQLAKGAEPLADDAWGQLIIDRLSCMQRSQLQRVINASGVLLHTNLGRAPLSDQAVAALTQVAGEYSNLELDLQSGVRGARHGYGEWMLQLLTGAQAALVVNNGAAAILLALTALAAGSSVLLSRGQMIEIGGSFRIPEVMAQSGCHLHEVGTTNKTHLSDYATAITPNTAAILKVHTSNYKVIGFTGSPSTSELATLAHQHGLLFIEDLGSGVLIPTEKYGLTHEPTIQESLASGADIVTCSGDKLLGGPQAGIILGRQELVQRCRKHPLARALRVGKLTMAALQATLMHYLRQKEQAIPLWQMCSLPVEHIAERARALAERLITKWPIDAHWQVRVIPGLSPIGGGSLPGETLPTMLLSLTGKNERAPERLMAMLRWYTPPVITRIEDEQLLIDLRTVAATDDEVLFKALDQVLATSPGERVGGVLPGNAGREDATCM